MNDQDLGQRDAVRGLLDFRTIAIRAESLDQASRSVEAVIATGNRIAVPRMPKSSQIVEEILVPRGAETPESVPLLANHHRSSLGDLLGSARSFTVSDTEVGSRLHFADGDPDAERAYQKVQQGHLRDVSVGYRILEAVEIPPGRTQQVAGQTYTAGKLPLRVVPRWRVREVSLTPLGADELAKIRAEIDVAGDTDASSDKETAMNVLLRKYLESIGLRSDATVEQAWEFFGELGESQREIAESLKTRAGDKAGDNSHSDDGSKDDAKGADGKKDSQRSAAQEPTSQGASGDVALDADAIRREERDRIAMIRRIAPKGLDQAILQRAESEGWDEDRASREFLGFVRVREPAVTGDTHIRVTDAQNEGFRQALSDALMAQSSLDMSQVIKEEARRRAADEFKAIGFQDLARVVLRHEHQDYALGGDILFKRAVSTGSYAQIVSDSAAKTLMAAYEQTPGTLMQWAGTRTVPNFKEHKDIRLSQFSSLAEVGKGGEIQHGTLSEGYEVHQATTYGRRFSLDRKTWLNDDTGAFMRVPQMLGQLAKMNIDEIGYDLLVSNSGVGPTMVEGSAAMFYATHDCGGTNVANYATGSGSALGKAGLKSAKALMRKMRGIEGNHIVVTPRWLLVPSDLEELALEFTTSPTIMIGSAGTTDTTTYQPMRNVNAGMFGVIVEPRLDGATNGTTAWYLIGSGAESIVIVSLRGNLSPVVERKDPVDVLGIGWWMYHDVGVAAVDWRGIVRMKGA